MGCPIRRSPDQRALASPRGLSQRATSFVASRRQGIHQMPFVHSQLITPPQPQDQRAEDRRQKTEGQITEGPTHRHLCILSSVFCALSSARFSSAEAGQHTHAVEHAHTTGSRRIPSTGACPRSLARHSPCHRNDPIPCHRKGSWPSHHLPLAPASWPAGRGPREAADFVGCHWWARADSNGRPHPYQGCALTS